MSSLQRFVWLLVLCVILRGISWAAPLQINGETDLSFGEMAVLNTGAPAFLRINPTTNASTLSNVVQIGTAVRGTFNLVGSQNAIVTVTISQGGFTCDTTYLGGACFGVPTLALTHDFPGTITSNNCPQSPRCIQLVGVGGQMDFAGTNTGRWNNNITIVANYQ